jgi:hypothetical protein
MRNIKTIISASAILLMVCIISPTQAQGVQKEAEKSKPVPATVTAILEKSCIGCHSDDGSTLAKMKFNFTKWNEYSAEEQNNPEAKLSDAEKTTICNWAGQL